MKYVYPEPNTGCWLWAGYSIDGYGRVCDTKRGITLAHRLSYFFHKGDFNRALHVLHKCDNPSCVNPDHLFLGDVFINNADRVNKGRSAKGISCGRSVLNESDIINIRALYNSGKFTQLEISKKYSVTRVNIMAIVNRKSWKHL